jgi:hypothetical protein
MYQRARRTPSYLLLALFAWTFLSSASHAGCGANCVASGWQKSSTIQYLSVGNPPSTPEPTRLVGFGSALANANISCTAGENPPLTQAETTWKDFRFYGSSPTLGLFRGEIVPDKRSFVHLDALTSSGLFPAEFTNNVFIRVVPLAFPALEYRNSTVMSVRATNVSQAPPPVTVVGLQVNAEDHLDVVTPMPGAPDTIVLTEGKQSFLPSGCLTAQRLSAPSGVLRIRVGYPGTQPVKAAYFLHSALPNPAGFENLDGLVTIPAAGTVNVDLSLTGVPAGGAIFEAIVLEPFSVDCAVRLPLSL